MSVNKKITVAALQTSFSADLKSNIAKVSALVREAAGKGAQIILPPELFEGLYFPQEEKDEFFSQAHPVNEHPAVLAMQSLARELKVVIPTSFFEKDGQNFYNSLAAIDDEGRILGVYRKSHIPDGPGYEEKFYFRPGNTGFKVWNTKFAKIGVGICWDQWFPECARAMVLMGADILFYPTAIGSEPQDPKIDTRDPWQKAMMGHSVSNVAPVIASNRTGKEGLQNFYGSSFITDHRGEKISELGRTSAGMITAELDLDRIRTDRASFGFFRDRRPELYGVLAER